MAPPQPPVRRLNHVDRLREEASHAKAEELGAVEYIAKGTDLWTVAQRIRVTVAGCDCVARKGLRSGRP